MLKHIPDHFCSCKEEALPHRTLFSIETISQKSLARKFEPLLPFCNFILPLSHLFKWMDLLQICGNGEKWWSLAAGTEWHVSQTSVRAVLFKDGTAQLSRKDG